MSALSDTLTPFAEAAIAYVDLVRRVEAFDWSGPGLGDWDLRSLIGHTSRSLITVETYLDQPAERATVASAADYYLTVTTGIGTDGAAVTERGRAAGRALGDDPIGYVCDLSQRVLARVRAIEASGEDPILTSIAGPIVLSDYLPTRTFELVVHGFDIAAAADLGAPAYSRATLAATAALAAEIAVAQGRGRELLQSLTGRHRLPTGFSVV